MNMKKQNREQQRLSVLFLFIIRGMIFELWLFNREKANIFLYYRFPLTSILPLDYTNKNINCLKLPNFMAIQILSKHFTPNNKHWRHGDARWKVLDSSKSWGFILWGLSIAKFPAIWRATFNWIFRKMCKGKYILGWQVRLGHTLRLGTQP